MTSDAAPRSRAGTPTILVVDDDPAIREAVRGILTDEGYDVALAEDGLEALDCLASMPPPSLILLDLRMPRMDGWEFLARRDAAHSDGSTPRVPIVLLSGMTFIRDAPGVVDFLAKPLRPEKLLECVRRFCPL